MLRRLARPTLRLAAMQSRPILRQSLAHQPTALHLATPARCTARCFATSSPDLLQQFRTEVDTYPVFLYMKGSPTAPQCGFSAKTVELLAHLGASFAPDGAAAPAGQSFVVGTRNVLASPEVRVGVKEFSDWPTFPQLYVKGEFVGGWDLVREMFVDGELTSLLVDKQIMPPPKEQQ